MHQCDVIVSAMKNMNASEWATEIDTTVECSSATYVPVCRCV